jgi:hypothetical protein
MLPASRRTLLAPALRALTVGVLAACGDGATESSSIAGTYTATTFRATPSGQAATIDVLARAASSR